MFFRCSPRGDDLLLAFRLRCARGLQATLRHRGHQCWRWRQQLVRCCRVKAEHQGTRDAGGRCQAARAAIARRSRLLIGRNGTGWSFIMGSWEQFVGPGSRPAMSPLLMSGHVVGQGMPSLRRYNAPGAGPFAPLFALETGWLDGASYRCSHLVLQLEPLGAVAIHGKFQPASCGPVRIQSARSCASAAPALPRVSACSALQMGGRRAIR